MVDNEFIQCSSFTERIQETSSRVQKAFILLDSRNEIIAFFLRFLLDKNITTGISTAKINKKLRKELNPDIDMGFFDVCRYISENPANDDTLWVVQSYIAKVGAKSKDKEFAKQVFTKKLRIGIEAKTVNQAYGYMVIPNFEVQLAKSIENVKIQKGQWFSISQKINGNRCVCYRGKLYSRQGKLWSGLDHILEDLTKVFDLSNCCLDGELVYKNEEGLSDNDAFIKGTGILNSNDSDKSCIKYVIFDFISNEDFDAGCSDSPYMIRRLMLNEVDKSIKARNLQNIEIVRFFYAGIDETQIDYWLNYATNAGMEGIMINYNTPYLCKRHSGILKAKRFYTMDLPITSFEAGEGRLSNTLGKVYVKYKENTVGVGSGFTDELRSEIWNNQDKYLGKIIEVKYKNISKDKNTGLESLQFPVFVRFREDKTEVSYD